MSLVHVGCAYKYLLVLVFNGKHMRCVLGWGCSLGVVRWPCARGVCAWVVRWPCARHCVRGSAAVCRPAGVWWVVGLRRCAG